MYLDKKSHITAETELYKESSSKTFVCVLALVRMRTVTVLHISKTHNIEVSLCGIYIISLACQALPPRYLVTRLPVVQIMTMITSFQSSINLKLMIEIEDM